MKLSEAIRLGAMLRPQIYGTFFGNEFFYKGSCAIGAAYEATFGLPKEHDGVMIITKLCQTYPILDHPAFRHQNHMNCFGLIARWNDHYRLTREQIADKVEELEKRLEFVAAQPESQEAYAESIL